MQSTRDIPSVSRTLRETWPKSEARSPESEDSNVKPAASNSQERTAAPTTQCPGPGERPPVVEMDSVTCGSHDDAIRNSIIEDYIADTASESSTEPGDLFENQKGQPFAGQSQGSTIQEKFKVLGKRLDGGRPQYLIQCWMYAKRGGAAGLYLDRCLRKYEAQISRDLAEQGLL